MLSKDQPLNVEATVAKRYSAASQAAEVSLCCPVNFDSQHLQVLPEEIVQRDYGCGNPARDVREGETVLDLGSGGGKICYIASQIVGPSGQVWGVDMNDDMLALARRHQAEVARRIGWDNVRFFKGRIQDLALDLDRLEQLLSRQPVSSVDQWLQTQQQADQLRHSEPMISDQSVDVVISNCVLNLVQPRDRRQLFAEIFRVLRRGGRAVISDIVSDEPVPQRLQQDAQLWSGCISGAFVEAELLEAFEEAGFYGMEIVERQEQPWAVVEGIEFRSLTVRAFKGKQGPCLDHHQAVIYRGPWKSVVDDDGNVLHRGQPMAVCDKTYQLYTRAPYGDSILPVPPHTPVPPEQAQPYDGHREATRPPRETKRGKPLQTLLPEEPCCGEGCGE